MRHTWQQGALLSTTASANTLQSDTRVLDQGDSQARYLQARASVSWQPDEELPFYVSGSSSVYDGSYTDSSNQSTATQSWNGNAGVSYAASRNLRWAVNGSMASSISTLNGGETENRTATENGSVHYTADITKFGDASYNRNANASVRNQASTGAPANLTTSAGGGHGLGIPYALGGGASLNFGFDQGLTWRNDQLYGQNLNLRHNGNMSWTPVPTETLSGSANLSATDTLSRGGYNPYRFQTAILRGNGLSRISAMSSVKANASVSLADNGRGQRSKNTAATVGYQHARAFDVKGLRYALNFTMTMQSYAFDSKLQDYDRSGSTLDQSLNYNIGRAYVRLSGIVAKYSSGFSNSMIFIRIGRDFGNV